MGRIFFAISAFFFFFAAIGATFMPNPAGWGLVFLAVGLAIGDWNPWKRAPG